MSSRCPPAAALSAWLDDELGRSEASQIREHLERCETCCAEVVTWSSVARDLRSIADAPAAARGDCPDGEELLRYSANLCGKDEDERVEAHVLDCPACTAEVRRLIQSERAGSLEVGDSAAREVDASAPLRRLRLSQRPLVALAAALIALAVWRLAPVSNDDEVVVRGGTAAVQIEITNQSIEGRARPHAHEPVVAVLAHGHVVTRLREANGWTRVELEDGRRVWLRSSELKGP